MSIYLVYLPWSNINNLGTAWKRQLVSKKIEIHIELFDSYKVCWLEKFWIDSFPQKKVWKNKIKKCGMSLRKNNKSRAIIFFKSVHIKVKNYSILSKWRDLLVSSLT